jgi:hypothetical protein
VHKIVSPTRLREEKLRSSAKGLRGVVELWRARDADHGDVRDNSVTLQLAAGSDPVKSGHHHVQEDDVGLCRPGQLHPGRPIGRRHHFEISFRKNVHHQLAELRIVVDDQNGIFFFGLGELHLLRLQERE